MDIYAPIAQRLGISKIKIELDDLALKYLKPEVYYDLVESDRNAERTEREEFVRSDCSGSNDTYEECQYQMRQIDGRVKAFLQYL